jgi:hypothetical protein
MKMSTAWAEQRVGISSHVLSGPYIHLLLGAPNALLKPVGHTRAYLACSIGNATSYWAVINRISSAMMDLRLCACLVHRLLVPIICTQRLQNRTFGPYLAAMHRINCAILRAGAGPQHAPGVPV